MRDWARTRGEDGRLPLLAAVVSKLSRGVTERILKAYMLALYEVDVWTGLPVFGLAATGLKGDLELSYRLLRAYPSAIGLGRNRDMRIRYGCGQDNVMKRVKLRY